MENIKAKIMVDCNCNILGFTKPTVSDFEIENFELKERDTVIAFQDDSEWEAIIRYDSSCPEGMQWYAELNLEKEYLVSTERMEGRSEGARAAMPIGEIAGEVSVVTAMLNDGMDIETVKKYTRLSETRLRNILKNIKK